MSTWRQVGLLYVQVQVQVELFTPQVQVRVQSLKTVLKYNSSTSTGTKSLVSTHCNIWGRARVLKNINVLVLKLRYLTPLQ